MKSERATLAAPPASQEPTSYPAFVARRCRCHQISVRFTKRPLPQHEVVPPPIRVDEIHGLITAQTAS